MKKALSIAAKDLSILMKDKASLFWILGFPIAFALLFGAVFSSAGEGGPSAMTVAVANEDGSEQSKLFIEKLAGEDNINIEHVTREQAMDKVRTGQIGVAVIIKSGFGSNLMNINTMPDSNIEVAVDPSQKMQAGYLQGIISKARIQMALKQFSDPESLNEMIDDWQQEIDKDPDINPVLASTLKTFFGAWKNFVSQSEELGIAPGFTDDMFEIDTTDVERQQDNNFPATAFQVTCPQAMIWAILTCTLTFAISIVKEKERGTYQRLRVGPVSRIQILSGKGLACCLACCMVLVLLVVIAMIIFKMPVNNFLFLAIAAFCTVFSFVGIMTFASTVCKTEQAVSGAAWAIIMVMAMLGGGMMPLFIMPSWMQKVGSFSIVKWSIVALEGGIWRDLTFLELLKPCGILVGVGSLFFVMGFYLLKRSES